MIKGFERRCVAGRTVGCREGFAGRSDWNVRDQLWEAFGVVSWRELKRPE